MSDTNLRQTAQIKRLKAIVNNQNLAKDQRHRAAMRIIQLTNDSECSDAIGAGVDTSESRTATEMRNTSISAEQVEFAERVRIFTAMFDAALEEEKAAERMKVKAPKPQPAPAPIEVDAEDKSEPTPEPVQTARGLTPEQLDRLFEYKLAQVNQNL